MSAKQEIVRKIAKALLERSSKEREELIKISQLLQLLHRLYKEERDFRGFILNPNIPKDKKLEIVKGLRERLSISNKVDEVL
ncbi:MAG: F0F1 ATP synthase subunit delta, partial [Aquificaceae bacterium]